MKMKYVMTNHGPIIFPETIEHSAFRGLHSAREERKLESAGFVHGIDFDNADCYGESETLKMKSRPEDTATLKRFCDPYLN